jgi:hypothetical protein
MAQIPIEDQSDSRLVEYRTIREAELVRHRGLFVAEGRLVVRRLLENPRYRIRSVLLSRTAFDQLADALAPWLGRIPMRRLPERRVELGDVAGM